jgi:tetratricopeptide (TPR) repeat protein
MERELAIRYFTELRRRRTLLFVDNADNAGVLRSLLPPLGSLLLITSRQPIVLEGICLVRMGEMETADACALLTKITGEAMGGENMILEAWGRSPVAVRMAGSLLLRHPEIGVAGCVARAAKPDSSYAEASYDCLDEVTSGRWCALSAWEHSFDVRAASSVWSLEEGRAADIVDELAAYGLLERDAAEGRILFPDVFREFARSKQTTTEINQSVGAHSEYYASLADELAPLLTSGRRKSSGCMQRIQREQANFDAVLNRASESAQHSLAALRVAGSLFWYWNFSGALERGRTALSRCLRSSWAKAVPLVRAKALYGLGGMHFLQGSYKQAKSELQEAIQIAVEHGDPLLHGFATITLGMVVLEACEYSGSRESSFRKAMALQNESIRILTECGHAWGAALAHNDLGRVLQVYKGYADAEESFRRSLDLWNELDDDWGRALTLNTWGVAALEAGYRTRAAKLLDDALESQRAIGDVWGIAGTLLYISDIHAAAGELAPAIQCLYESLQLNRQLGRQRLLQRCLVRAAVLADRLDEPDYGERFRRDAQLFGSPVDPSEISNLSPNSPPWESRLQAAIDWLQRLAHAAGA